MDGTLDSTLVDFIFEAFLNNIALWVIEIPERRLHEHGGFNGLGQVSLEIFRVTKPDQSLWHRNNAISLSIGELIDFTLADSRKTGCPNRLLCLKFFIANYVEKW